MVGQDALWPPHQRYVEADDSFSSGLKCWWLLRSGQNACTFLPLWRGAPNPSKHPHISQEHSSFRQQAFVCFWMSWISSVAGTFTIILIGCPNIYFPKRKKFVYMKSAKEQHLVKPQQLLMFSVSLFLITSGKKFLTSYLSFWQMLRATLTFAQIYSESRFPSLAVYSLRWFTYNESNFPPYKIFCHCFSVQPVCLTRSFWNPQ